MFHLGPKNPRFIVLSTDSENVCISRDGTASSEYHPTHLTHLRPLTNLRRLQRKDPFTLSIQAFELDPSVQRLPTIS